MHYTAHTQPAMARAWGMRPSCGCEHQSQDSQCSGIPGQNSCISSHQERQCIALCVLRVSPPAIRYHCSHLLHCRHGGKAFQRFLLLIICACKEPTPLEWHRATVDAAATGKDAKYLTNERRGHRGMSKMLSIVSTSKLTMGEPVSAACDKVISLKLFDTSNHGVDWSLYARDYAFHRSPDAQGNEAS